MSELPYITRIYFDKVIMLKIIKKIISDIFDYYHTSPDSLNKIQVFQQH